MIGKVSLSHSLQLSHQLELCPFRFELCTQALFFLLLLQLCSGSGLGLQLSEI